MVLPFLSNVLNVYQLFIYHSMVAAPLAPMDVFLVVKMEVVLAASMVLLTMRTILLVLILLAALLRSFTMTLFVLAVQQAVFPVSMLTLVLSAIKLSVSLMVNVSVMPLMVCFTVPKTRNVINVATTILPFLASITLKIAKVVWPATI
jgi:hypothetical protein